MSKQPDWQHQLVSFRLGFFLETWNEQSQSGFVNLAPGIIFTNDTNVIPDLVWISQQRLKTALHPDGKLYASPELVVEILSPGPENENFDIPNDNAAGAASYAQSFGKEYRDREVKLKLYSRRNAQEYWVINWREQTIEIYRRYEGILELAQTLNAADVLQSPLLPSFRCQVSQLFTSIVGL